MFRDEDEWSPKEGFDPSKKYTGAQLSLLADEILKQDSDREMCRKCGSQGEETGREESMIQIDEHGTTSTDDNGDALYVIFPEIECPKGHRWFKGEGRRKGLAGESPILFESHLKDRKRREIHNNTGVPDPGIVSGVYWRAHPQGRKINTENQRAKHGASYFK